MVALPTLMHKAEARNRRGQTLNQFMRQLDLYLPGAWTVWAPENVPHMTLKRWETLWERNESPESACWWVHDHISPSTWLDLGHDLAEQYRAGVA